MNKHINKNRKPSPERKVVFGGEIHTYKIPKYMTNKEGKVITGLNKRTMAKKALKAYIKGDPFYSYKGSLLVVPRVSPDIKTNTKEEEE